jgi:hypothetical protein
MLTRRLLAAGAATVLVLAAGSLTTASAAARRAGPGAECPPGQDNCDVWHDGETTRPDRPGNGDNPGGGGGGTRTCVRDNQPIACYDDLLGYFNNSDGCYYKLEEPQRPDAPQGQQWYLRSCAGAQEEVLLDAAPDGFGTPPDPVELANRALASITLEPPPVHVAPNKGAGLVGLPVWMWTDQRDGTWGELTASASAPGLTVSISAKVKKIVWDMGNEEQIPCQVPGTAYDPNVHRGGKSPDCGYPTGYPRSSRREPGGVYKVTATTTWQVLWTGGGTSGELPPQTRTSSAPGTVRIDELQVVTQ